MELDGHPWRRLPVAVVTDVGLVVGSALDRERARAIARSRRRSRAEEAAVRALARRDHSRASLEQRLSRARVPAPERHRVVERAVVSGLVDDKRFAADRSRQLAARGAGDLLVLDDLKRHGVTAETAAAAVASLEPEGDRAARIVIRRGASAKTLRYLAQRGFTEATLEGLVADVESWALR